MFIFSFKKGWGVSFLVDDLCVYLNLGIIEVESVVGYCFFKN